MSRPLRLEYPGAVWHVTARGNERKPICRDDDDRKAFLATLERVVLDHGWLLHAWVLMGNHYHLLMETPDPTLSAGMRQLNGIYTQAFNRRHRRSGHLFQGRFKGILVAKEYHLLELIRYVVRNPVRAKLCEKPADWPWSSYRATAGLAKAPAWLHLDWTQGVFNRRSRAQARREYQRYCTARRGEEYRPWEGLTGQIYLGDEAFVRALAKRLRGRARSREIARTQQAPAGPDWTEIERRAERAIDANSSDSGRSAWLCAVARRQRVPLAEIGRHLDIHPSYASKLAARIEHHDKLRRQLDSITKQGEENT